MLKKKISKTEDLKLLNSGERELNIVPEVWAKDNPPPPPPHQACKTSPGGNRTQIQYNYVSTCLGPARLC